MDLSPVVDVYTVALEALRDGPVQGRCGKYDIPALLARVARQGLTGRLLVAEGTQARRVIGFDAGVAVLAGSNVVQERLGPRVLERGTISPAQALEVENLIASEGLQFGAAMVKLGYLPREQLQQTLTWHQSWLISQCLSAGEADCAFDHNANIPSGGVGLPLYQCIEDGIRAYSPAETEALVGQLHSWHFLVEEADVDLAMRMGCSPGVMQLCELVQGAPCAFHELIASSEDRNPQVPGLTLVLTGMARALPTAAGAQAHQEAFTGEAAVGADLSPEESAVKAVDDVDSFLADLAAPGSGCGDVPEATGAGPSQSGMDDVDALIGLPGLDDSRPGAEELPDATDPMGTSFEAGPGVDLNADVLTTQSEGLEEEMHGGEEPSLPQGLLNEEIAPQQPPPGSEPQAAVGEAPAAPAARPAFSLGADLNDTGSAFAKALSPPPSGRPASSHLSSESLFQMEQDEAGVGDTEPPAAPEPDPPAPPPEAPVTPAHAPAFSMPSQERQGSRVRSILAMATAFSVGLVSGAVGLFFLAPKLTQLGISPGYGVATANQGSAAEKPPDKAPEEAAQKKPEDAKPGEESASDKAPSDAGGEEESAPPQEPPKQEAKPDPAREKAERHLARGNKAYERERYNVAINEYRKAARLAPDNGLVHRALGVAYTMTQKYDRAVVAYKKYLELMPDAEDAPQLRQMIEAYESQQ